MTRTGTCWNRLQSSAYNSSERIGGAPVMRRFILSAQTMTTAMTTFLTTHQIGTDVRDWWGSEHHIILFQTLRFQFIAECAMQPWSPWSPCSPNCGKGSRKRTRRYVNEAVARQFGCDRRDSMEKICHNPQSCKWGIGRGGSSRGYWLTLKNSTVF